VRQRVAALHEEFQRIVEAGGVGLALVGDRLGDRALITPFVSSLLSAG
jgi:hypothetical protein